MTTRFRTLFPRAARLTVSALMVAMLGSLTLTAWAQGGPGMHGGPVAMGGHGMHGGDGLPMMGGARFERLLDRVNATPDQRAQIKQIAERARTDMQGQHEAHRALRDQMAKLFAAPVVDANAVESLRQQMLAQHDAQSRRMTQVMLDISRVLTPEQRKQIAERMAQRRDMMERHMRERQQLDGKPAPR